MIMALTEHRFHPFSLTFSATWLSPSSHRVTAKSYSVGLCRHHSLGTGTQPSVLHRSAQNGTGARKEMCRCSCPAMPEIQIVAKPCPEAEQDPCQLGIFFYCETKFSTVRWKLTLLDMVHGSTFCSVFAAVGSFEALSGLSFGPL